MVNVFSLVTGVIFLNMSFLLAEVSILERVRSNQASLSLTMALANAMAEEEPGSGKESSFSESDIIVNHWAKVEMIDIFSNNKFGAWSHGHPIPGEFEIRKPPPQA